MPKDNERVTLLRAVYLYLILDLAVLSAGCTSVLIAGASGGIGYTIMNVAYKTVTYPLGEVEAAVHGALKKMAISETQREEIETGVRIIAETPELTIYIDLDRITNNVTKISVDARKNFVIKDESTAAEIILQTEKILRQVQSRPFLSPNARVFCKNSSVARHSFFARLFVQQISI